MITRNKAVLLPDGLPDKKALANVLKEFQTGRTRLEDLRKAYDNEHEIEGRTRHKGLPNNKLAHAFPRYIVTMSAGYLLGKPVAYSAPDDQAEKIGLLMDAYRKTDIDSEDAELAKDASIYGRAVEILYSNERSEPKAATLNPESAFVVYDDTVEAKPILGVYFYETFNANGASNGYIVKAYTENKALVYTTKTIGGTLTFVEGDPTFFGGVPIIEYWNNENEDGDFEHVMSLVDAYNVLESDRVNDKEQFVDAILVLTGCTMQDDEKGRTPAQQLRQDRMLSLPDSEAKAEYLAHALDENNVEVLKNAIKADIHKFSMVPDLTDMQFAGNGSGVAMRYKMLGLENLIRIKERWFKQGLRERLRRFAAFLKFKAVTDIDPEAIEMAFGRGLPVNELEISQMFANYAGRVPDVLLLGQVPFIDNPADAFEKLTAQREAEAKASQAAFGLPMIDEE
jgi:SPP1 family phage portal protein